MEYEEVELLRSSNASSAAEEAATTPVKEESDEERAVEADKVEGDGKYEKKLSLNDKEYTINRKMDGDNSEKNDDS